MAVSVKGLLLFLLVLCTCVSWISAQTPAPAPRTPAPPVDDDEDEAPEPGVEPEDEIWTWCVTDASDKPTCDSMVQILAGLDPEKEHTHNCIIGNGDEDCMKKVQSGEAKFVILDGGEIWEANNEYGLKPIRTEVSALEGSYYGVGIVKAGKCPGSLSDLKGKRSCHTGYNRATGWVFPVTYLVDNKIMPVVTTGPQSNDIESVKAFFKASCAANSDPNKEICTACKIKNACTKSDPYYDYEGAFRGLVEDACDVAFTKHTIVGQYAVGGRSAASDWTGLQDASNYEILCPNKYNGKVCTDPANYKACNFGQAPGHAIMVAKDYPDYEINEFNNVMNAANSDPAFINLFFSGNNKEGHIFAPDATRTVIYTGTTQALLGNFYKNIQDLESINAQKTSPNNGDIANTVSASLSLIAGLLYLVFQ